MTSAKNSLIHQSFNYAIHYWMLFILYNVRLFYIYVTLSEPFIYFNWLQKQMAWINLFVYFHYNSWHKGFYGKFNKTTIKCLVKLWEFKLYFTIKRLYQCHQSIFQYHNIFEQTVIFAYCWTRVTFALGSEFGRKKKSIWLMHVSEQTYPIEKNYFSLCAKISKSTTL